MSKFGKHNTNILKAQARVNAAAKQVEESRRAIRKARKEDPEAFQKVWSVACSVCNATPTVKVTGMCGPCTFGEAKTAGGNW